MLKKIALVFFVGIFFSALWANGDVSAPAAKDEVGYVLLDKIIIGFQKMAGEGSGGYEFVDRLLQEAMAEAKVARAQGKIDAYFFKRYARMLLVAKLAIVNAPYDREGILDGFITREINSYIEDVTGEPGSLRAEGENKRGVGAIAGAMADEILNLHIYLDGLKNKPELLKKFLQK